MRNKIAVAVGLAFAVSASLEAEEPTVYRVSEAGKDKAKLMRVFEAVRDKESSKPDTMVWKVTQHIKGDLYLGKPFSARKVVLSTGEVYYRLLRAGDEAAVEMPAGTVLVDGAQSEPGLWERAGVYEFVTVLGAKRRVALYNVRKTKLPPKMSRDTFLRRLKAGETFEIVLPKGGRCQNCRGFGEVRNPGGSRIKGNVKCPECRGTGVARGGEKLKVVWK